MPNHRAHHVAVKFRLTLLSFTQKLLVLKVCNRGNVRQSFLISDKNPRHKCACKQNRNWKPHLLEWGSLQERLVMLFLILHLLLHAAKGPSLPVFTQLLWNSACVCVCMYVFVCVCVCVCALVCVFMSFTSAPIVINNNITSLYRLSPDLCVRVQVCVI